MYVINHLNLWSQFKAHLKRLSNKLIIIFFLSWRWFLRKSILSLGYYSVNMYHHLNLLFLLKYQISIPNKISYISVIDSTCLSFSRALIMPTSSVNILTPCQVTTMLIWRLLNRLFIPNSLQSMPATTLRPLYLRRSHHIPLWFLHSQFYLYFELYRVPVSIQ